MDALHFGLMSSEDILGRVITSKRLEHLNDRVIGYSKQMSTFGKLDFFTHFNLNFFDDDKIVFINIHHSNFITESYDLG
jgi:hypothetical protein